jgi:hypothetical protein
MASFTSASGGKCATITPAVTFYSSTKGLQVQQHRNTQILRLPNKAGSLQAQKRDRNRSGIRSFYPRFEP